MGSIGIFSLHIHLDGCHAASILHTADAGNFAPPRDRRCSDKIYNTKWYKISSINVAAEIGMGVGPCIHVPPGIEPGFTPRLSCKRTSVLDGLSLPGKSRSVVQSRSVVVNGGMEEILDHTVSVTSGIAVNSKNFVAVARFPSLL